MQFVFCIHIVVCALAYLCIPFALMLVVVGLFGTSLMHLLVQLLFIDITYNQRKDFLSVALNNNSLSRNFTFRAIKEFM